MRFLRESDIFITLGMHRESILLLLCATSIGARLDAQDPAREPTHSAPWIWGELTSGPYGVGYRKLNSPHVVHVWYPRADRQAPGRMLRLRDYLGAADSATTAFLSSAGIARSTIDSALNAPVAAVRDALPHSHAFPVILMAQGNAQDAFDQAILSEYLASYGYVVVSTPSPMLRTPMERLDQTGAFAEEQSRELLDAMTRANQVAHLEQAAVVIGHSFGARSALLAAMQSPRIRGIVSLDGGIGTATAIDELESAPSFNVARSVPGVLHFYEELDSFMKPDFSFLRGLSADTLVLERTHAMRHVHFTTYGFAANRFPEFARVTRGTPETGAEVERVAARTLAWIQQALARRSPSSS